MNTSFINILFSIIIIIILFKSYNYYCKESFKVYNLSLKHNNSNLTQNEKNNKDLDLLYKINNDESDNNVFNNFEISNINNIEINKYKKRLLIKPIVMIDNNKIIINWIRPDINMFFKIKYIIVLYEKQINESDDKYQGPYMYFPNPETYNFYNNKEYKYEISNIEQNKIYKVGIISLFEKNYFGKELNMINFDKNNCVVVSYLSKKKIKNRINKDNNIDYVKCNEDGTYTKFSGDFQNLKNDFKFKKSIKSNIGKNHDSLINYLKPLPVNSNDFNIILNHTK